MISRIFFDEIEFLVFPHCEMWTQCCKLHFLLEYFFREINLPNTCACNGEFRNQRKGRIRFCTLKDVFHSNFQGKKKFIPRAEGPRDEFFTSRGMKEQSKGCNNPILLDRWLRKCISFRFTTFVNNVIFSNFPWNRLNWRYFAALENSSHGKNFSMRNIYASIFSRDFTEILQHWFFSLGTALENSSHGMNFSMHDIFYHRKTVSRNYCQKLQKIRSPELFSITVWNDFCEWKKSQRHLTKWFSDQYRRFRTKRLHYLG